MKVKELMELLSKCPKDAIVMYDIENSIKNESWMPGDYDSTLPIDDVSIGMGTWKGFVILEEEPYT